MKLRLAGVKEFQQHIKSKKVINGANGSDQKHEIPDQAHIPAPRRAKILRVHVIGRNGDLRRVVEKIVEQDLRGEHRQKRQKCGGARHAEHIAEIGAGAHQHVL